MSRTGPTIGTAYPYTRGVQALPGGAAQGGLHKMIQKVTAKRARQREEAAQHVAGDYLTDERIAAQVGICRRTLGYWKRQPDFAARVGAVRAAYHARITAEFMARAPGFAQNDPNLHRK